MYYSETGSSKYTLSPFKIEKKPLCDFLNNEYRKYFMHRLAAAFEFPLSEDEDENLCTMFEKVRVKFFLFFA